MRAGLRQSCAVRGCVGDVRLQLVSRRVVDCGQRSATKSWAARSSCSRFTLTIFTGMGPPDGRERW